MPTLDEVLSFREKMYQSSTALIRKKGADYNREQQIAGNTLFNLTVCELLGIVDSTETGILVRLSDKFMRLISLTKPGREAEVKDESVLDTINDLHNYADYLGLVWQERRRGVMVAVGGFSPQDIKLDPGPQQRYYDKDLDNPVLKDSNWHARTKGQSKW